MRTKIGGKDQKIREIRYTRDIFGRLLYLAITQKLDLAEVLSFPLTDVPFSLCHISGAMNKTDKSALLKKLEAKVSDNEDPSQIDAYIVECGCNVLSAHPARSPPIRWWYG